jgi:hypothetical protein
MYTMHVRFQTEHAFHRIRRTDDREPRRMREPVEGRIEVHFEIDSGLMTAFAISSMAGGTPNHIFKHQVEPHYQSRRKENI